MSSVQEKTSQDVAKALWKAQSVTIKTRPSFRWASGLHSPLYTDNRLVLAHPQQRQQILNGFIKLIKLKRISCDVIAGVATSGIPWATMIAAQLKKPLVYVRPVAKAHGKGRQVEGFFAKGARILLIEDLVSTGMSSLHALKALRKEKARVTNTLAIFAYFPEKATALFQKSHCALHCLSDADTLLAVGKRSKKIGPKQIAAAEKFLVALNL
jgi:orotate phosphoribosyltransferase